MYHFALRLTAVCCAVQHLAWQVKMLGLLCMPMYVHAHQQRFRSVHHLSHPHNMLQLIPAGSCTQVRIGFLLAHRLLKNC